jgi:thioesterase domain-containing protein
MSVNSPQDFADWTARLERLWREKIPLAAAMGARVSRLDADGLVATAPLPANVNHMGTAFGGGLQALATLAGWAVTLVTAARPDHCRVVIREAQMRFLAPVREDLRARADWPSGDEARVFRDRLAGQGRARLEVGVRFGTAEAPEAVFRGEFVAMLTD